MWESCLGPVVLVSSNSVDNVTPPSWRHLPAGCRRYSRSVVQAFRGQCTSPKAVHLSSVTVPCSTYNLLTRPNYYCLLSVTYCLLPTAYCLLLFLKRPIAEIDGRSGNAGWRDLPRDPHVHGFAIEERHAQNHLIVRRRSPPAKLLKAVLLPPSATELSYSVAPLPIERVCDAESPLVSWAVKDRLRAGLVQ